MQPLINVLRFIDLVGFDTFLKQAYMMVKLCSMLEQDISVFIYMRIKDTKSSMIALADFDQQIFAGTRFFWDVVDKNKLEGSSITNICELSFELSQDVSEFLMLNSELKTLTDGREKSLKEKIANEKKSLEEIRSLQNIIGQRDRINSFNSDSFSASNLELLNAKIG